MPPHSGAPGTQRHLTILILITNPRVLFLDEPTSGLDSFTANEIVNVVKGLANSGVTIVATIHSPTAYVFGLFDRVMMLSCGNMVYTGPSGQRMLDYVAAHMPKDLLVSAAGAAGGPASAIFNQSDYLVDLVTEADHDGRSAEIAAAFAASSLRAENDAHIAAFVKSVTPDGSRAEEAAEAKALATCRATGTPAWHAFKTLIKYRTARNYMDPLWLLPRFADKVIMGLLVVSLWWQVGKSLTPTNIMNSSSLLFMWVVLSAFGSAGYLPSMMLERPLFVRERNNGLYNVISYMLAKAFDELSLVLPVSLGVAAIVCFGVGFSGQFVLFWLIYFVTLCFGIMLAYLVAAIAPNMDAANALLPAYVTALMFLGGLLINFQDVPVWWKWFTYINPVKYGWGALMVNQFSNTNPVYNGVPVLALYGFQDADKWQSFGLEFVFVVVFFFLAYMAMSMRKFTSR